MKRVIALMIVLGAMLWAVEPWTGTIDPVPWWVMDNTGNQISHNYRGIFVLNDSVAWVVGEDGQVWKRVDSLHNHHWQNMSSYVPNGIMNHFNDVCFVTPDTGWIVGEKRTEPDKYRGIVYKTVNGGASWDSMPTPSLPLPTPFLKVRFAWASAVGDYVGYIACGNGVVLYSEDAGDNWVRRPSPWQNADSTSVWYNGLWADPNNSSNLWTSGDAFGVFSKSTDGGEK